MKPELGQELEGLVQALRASQRVVVFTGAGMSTESGISDYRSKGGLWDRFQPVTLQEFLASAQKRREYWHEKSELMKQMGRAKPNAGHFAIAHLEKIGKLIGVITQNIDGLHQMAGNSPERVVELHGTNREIVCLSCGAKRPWQEIFERLEKGEEIPLCSSCGGLLKPNTISFGQNLDPRTLEKADRLSRECDLFLAVGSTLIVQPAASFPVIAKRSGARLAIINLSETPLDSLADWLIRGQAGQILKEAVDALGEGKS